jgi:hypothetical protein
MVHESDIFISVAAIHGLSASLPVVQDLGSITFDTLR